jgi:hypothetical protein
MVSFFGSHVLITKHESPLTSKYCNPPFTIQDYTPDFGSRQVAQYLAAFHNRIFLIHASSPIIGELNRRDRCERCFRAEAQVY